jgi:hypothetical protein
VGWLRITAPEQFLLKSLKKRKCMLSHLTQDELLNEFHQQLRFAYNTFSLIISTSKPSAYTNDKLSNAQNHCSTAEKILAKIEPSTQKILLTLSLQAAQAYLQYLFKKKFLAC